MGCSMWLGRDRAWRLEVNLPQDSVNKGRPRCFASGTGAGFDPDVETVHDATYAAGQTGFAGDT